MDTTPILISSACLRRNMAKTCISSASSQFYNLKMWGWRTREDKLLRISLISKCLLSSFSAYLWLQCWHSLNGEWSEVHKDLKVLAKRRAKHCCCSSSLTNRFPTDMGQAMVSRKSFQIHVKDKAPLSWMTEKCFRVLRKQDMDGKTRRESAG